MAKKVESKLWDGIYENDFTKEKNLELTDIGEYDLKHMTLFGSNVNLFRQIIRLSDSLKPVERRILYALYQAKAFPGKKLKSTMITGYTAVYHCHGDSYPSLVGMAQPWKKQCPLIDGKGNFGNAAFSEMYAADRYTEASMSQYAKECFFDDYDEDCVEMLFNGASDRYEPMSLPAKFPNILVNGGMGIAFGNSFRIPSYNINDIIEACRKVLEDSENADIYMIPDLPCGCEILDDGHSFRDIVSTGKGILKMRAVSEIIEGNKNWIIKFTSLPWMTSLRGIESRIVELAENGTLPIKDKQDHSYAVKTNGKVITKIDFRIIIDKAHDPYNILNKLYTMTELQKSVSIDFKIVDDYLSVKRLNMRELITSWIDERRSYKRRLFNKKLTKISARIDLLEILIYLLKSDNIEKTIKIIKNSNSEDAIKQLMKFGKMNSYQASKIYDMRLSAFTKDARNRYKEEKENLTRERESLMKTIGSEKKIDEIIMNELLDLRKYATPRRSPIVEESNGIKIMDTTHTIILTNGGLIKKLAYDKNNPSKNNVYGSFKTGDFPICKVIAHNTSSMMFFDSFGRYSIIPIHQIDNSEMSHYGYKAYDYTKLYGKIITGIEEYDADLINRMTKKIGMPYLVTITANGYAKRTPMDVFLGMKNTKNIRAMKIRDDDSMVLADVLFESSIVLLYTKKGDYIILKVSDFAEQAKDSMGLMTIRVKDGDSVCGMVVLSNALNKKDPLKSISIITITEKGMVKLVDSQYLGEPGKRSKNQGSLVTLDSTDSLKFVCTIDWKNTKPENLIVSTRTLVQTIPINNIPNTTKKAKGKLLVNTGVNSYIIDAQVK